MDTHSVLTISNLHHQYGDIHVLNGINFSIQAGQIYGVLGANGAGKTTLINLMLGRLTPSDGEISIFGERPGSHSVKTHVGAMLQMGGLPANLTVLEQLKVFASYYDSPRALDNVLAVSGLENHLDVPFSKLSGGLKQRLLFAIAIVGNPRIVFLDEPSLAMDVTARQQMWRTIEHLKNEGKTIVLTTHYMEEAEALCDKLFILNEGKIVASGSAVQLGQQMQMSEISFLTVQSCESLNNQFPKWQWQVNNGYATVRCESPSKLLSVLFNAGFECERLSVKPASLEQTFLSLTKQELAA